MHQALRLAERGRGKTSPNPMVGAVLVARGRIVGTGYHHAAGQPHAEILALREAGSRAKGATLYLTLEPCCHVNKRTPPCVPAIIRSGIRRVVVATTDPNPLVRGRGLAQLRRAGVAVQVGLCRSAAERMNQAYTHWITTGRPYVTLKAGMTLDGRIATESGKSRWITGPASRQDVHRLRRTVDAVMVGIGTVLADDPALTARQPPDLTRLTPRQPLRVVVDSRLRIPLNAAVLKQQRYARTAVATTTAAGLSKRRALSRLGVEVLIVPAMRGRVRLASLLKILGRRGITHVLLEGGSELNAACLHAGLVNDVRLYAAPALMGGTRSIGVMGGSSPARPSQAVPLSDLRISRLGADLLIESRVGRECDR